MSNENAEICAACGGKCCRKIPGAAVPADINDDLELVDAAIENGRWCVDWYDGDPRGYGSDQCVERGTYVRPATIGRVGVVADPSWGGTCCMLTPSGCSLPFDERPKACRDLVPVGDGHCYGAMDKIDSAITWEQHWEWLEKIIDAERSVV